MLCELALSLHMCRAPMPPAHQPAHHKTAHAKAKHTAKPRPQEDDPGWNCATDGNHQCGPTTTVTVFYDLAVVPKVRVVLP